MNKEFSVDALIIFLVLVTPLLKYYDLPILGVGLETLFTMLLLGLCILLSFFPKKTIVPLQQVQSKRWYAIFLTWLILVTVAYELYTDINVNSVAANYNLSALIMPLLRAIIILSILSGRVRTDSCIKIYSFLIKLVTVVYLLQWVLLLGGMRISFKIPLLDFNASWGYLNENIFGMNGLPTSLFSERSHLCEFVVPYIAICLFSKNIIRKSRIRQAILYSIVVASTVSGNGVVLLFIVWALYFLVFAKFKKPHYKILIALFGIIGLIGLYFVLSSIPAFSEMFGNLFVDQSGSEFTSSKADYRIYRGLDIFTKLPLWGQFLGVGYKHMYLFSQKYNIVSAFDFSWQDVYEYFSALSGVMLYSGIIGLWACIKHFWALYKSKINVVRGLIIVMIALWFSTEMLFNSTHVLYITLIVSVLCHEKNIAEESLQKMYRDNS